MPVNDSETPEQMKRGSRCQLDHQSLILPKIERSELYRSVRGGGEAQNSRRKRLGISSIDGSTLISKRERKFKYSNVREKLKGFDFLAQNKENAGTFLLRSHHYKFNRIKEGGWGNINLSSDSSREGQTRVQMSSRAAAELMAAGSEASRGSKGAGKDVPLLFNSSSNMEDLWSHEPLPKLNAVHAAEMNRLIKMENQRGSIGRSTRDGQSAVVKK